MSYIFVQHRRSIFDVRSEGFTDLSQLNLLIWWFDFKLEPIFATAQAASKNEACSKISQN
jgi:hypothetical protein